MLSSPSCLNNACHGYLVLPSGSFLIISLLWNRIHTLVPLLPSQLGSHGMPLPIFFPSYWSRLCCSNLTVFYQTHCPADSKRFDLLWWPLGFEEQYCYFFSIYLGCFYKGGKENWPSSTAGSPHIWGVKQRHHFLSSFLFPQYFFLSSLSS